MLEKDFLVRWQDLENRSLEGNPFISPHFVLPCLRHLPESAGSDPIALAIEEACNGPLLGLGIFESCGGNRLLPLKHLRCWRSPHSFLDGMLVDRGRGEEVAVALFEWLKEKSHRWHGLYFRDRSADSELSCLLEYAAGLLGLEWREDWPSKRAAVVTGEVPQDSINYLFAGKRRRELRRRMRRLHDFGEPRYGLKLVGKDPSPCLERFLILEAMGWKSDQGTALLSNPGHSAFAREMVAGFASFERVAFFELEVEGRPIASALKLLAGENGFAFKIGWDPDYASSSPGVLCEVLFQQSVPEIDGVSFWDGCTVPGSWLEEFWPWRRSLTTGVFPTSVAGKLAVAGTTRIKAIKRGMDNPK